MKRILIFELNWMGDILFSFPFIRAIRKIFPNAYIECVVVPRYVDLLINTPWINDVHVLSDSNKFSSISEKIAFIRMIKKEKYDICFFLKPSRIKTVMALLAGIPERIGFAGKEAPLTKKVEMPSEHMHRADQILALAGAVGVTQADGTYEYFLSEEDEERAGILLHGAGGGIRRMVAVNPGGNWEAKRWPTGNFVRLAKGILNRFDDVEIMITGSKKDIKIAQDIVSNVRDNRCYMLAGKTGLNELAVLFKRCSLVISADSGPLHLASAVGCTTIGLFGPTSYKITGPRGKGENIVIQKDIDCKVPCYVKTCDRDYICMKAITVNEVFNAAKRVLSSIWR